MTDTTTDHLDIPTIETAKDIDDFLRSVGLLPIAPDPMDNELDVDDTEHITGEDWKKD